MSTIKTMNAKNYFGCGHTIDTNNVKTQEHIRLEKHRGLWYVIDFRHSDCFSEYKDGPCFFFLCEHEKMGDETAYVIINQNYEIVLEDAWNGFSDLKEYFADYNWEKAVDKFKHVNNTRLCGEFWLSSGDYNGEPFTVVVYSRNGTYCFYYKDGNKPTDSDFEQDFKTAILI